MKTILFACTRNSGRSQLAASIFNALSSASMVRAVSAGTHPAPSVQPEVVRALKEIGIEAGGADPQLLTPEVAGRADKLIAKEGWYKLRPIALLRLKPPQEGFRRSPPSPDSVAGAP